MKTSAFVIGFSLVTFCSTANTSAQNAPAVAQNTSTPTQNAPIGKASELRLGYSADAVVYPSLINEHAITVYRDPSDSRRRYYIKPVFIPKWEAFAKAVAESCTDAAASDERTVPLTVQFSSRKLNDEIVALLNKQANPQISTNQLFSYPIYALFVVSGAKDPEDNVSNKIQFRYPTGISEALPTGVVAALDGHLTNLGQRPPLRVRETCQNLSHIAVQNDLTAYAYAEQSEIKLNAATAIVSSFAQSQVFSDIDRDEKAVGVVKVKTRSGSSGLGFNLAGVFSGGGAKSGAAVLQEDTRRRFVSASIIQSAAEQAVLDGAIFARVEAIEFLDPAGITATLMKFVLNESSKVKARLDKISDDQWNVVTGEHTRSLSKEEVKLVLESAPKAELEASGKEQMDCSMMAGAATGGAGAAAGAAAASKGGQKQCGAERASKSSFSDNIKWEKNSKGEWVPTSLDLYVFNTQELRSRAKLSVEQALVTQAPQAQIHTLLHVTDSEPTDYLADQMDRKIEAVIARFEGPKPKGVVPFSGGLYKTIGYFGNKGSGQTVFACATPLVSPGAQHEQIGGQDIAVYDQRNLAQMGLALGCRGAAHCDSAGEWCVSYHRAAGCFIDKGWLKWYRERKKGAPDVVAEICAPGL